MAWHEKLWPELQDAIAGKKFPARGIIAGSLNYGLMSAGASVIVDPTPARIADWNGLMDGQVKIGHQAHQGPNGVQCEQGDPGEHWSFSAGSVGGVYLKGPDECRPGCEAWLLREAGLDRAFRWHGRVCMPGTRVKDQLGQAPLDGYRDLFTSMCSGEMVRKTAKYWAATQATAVRVWRVVLDQHPELIQKCKAAPVPNLYLPIQTKAIDGGGYEAWIEDTPQARSAMGNDACHRVRCSTAGIQWWYDWKDGDPAGTVAA